MNMATNPYLYSQYQGPGVGFGPGPDIVPRAQTPAPVASQYTVKAPTPPAPGGSNQNPVVNPGGQVGSAAVGGTPTPGPGTPFGAAVGGGTPSGNPPPLGPQQTDPAYPGGPTRIIGSGTGTPTTTPGGDGSGLTGGAAIPGATDPGTSGGTPT